MRTQHSFLTRDNPVTLEQRDGATFRPNTFNVADNTVEAIIATNAPVPRTDARGTFLEILDIAGADLASLRGASVLDAHRQGGVASVLGTVDEAWREGAFIIARLRLSTRPELAAIVQDVRNGIINSVSVGYEVQQWQDGTDASGKRTRTAVKWTPREVSMVPVSADPNARTRSAPTDRTETNRAIRDLCQRAGVSSATVDGLIDRSATVEDARNMIFDELITRGAVPIRTSGHTSTDDPEVFVRAAGEALFTRVTPSHAPSGIARQYVGMTIPDIARACLHRAGVNVMGLAAPALIERALHTTSDFALILADTVGRTLRQSYTAPASGIRTLARETSVNDFRKKSRLMLDSSGMTLEKVNEHGEFQSGTMAEAGESYAIDSFGRIFGITRKAMINDDLGAFTDLSRRLGQAATAFEAQFLVNLLIANAGLGPVMSDTKKLFDAAHGNIAATPIDWTAGSPPELYGLDTARLAMRKQTGPGGGLIDVTPKFVMVPAELETIGEKILSSIQATVVSDVNPFDRLTLVVEPRLTDAHRWYVVGDPAQIDGLEFAYLAGAPGPQIETKVGFEVDGIQLKVRLDYGGGFIDHRGWYTNAGH